MQTTITASDLPGLLKDDQIIGPAILPGLTDEPIKLRVLAPGKTKVSFIATYHGVTLGSITAEITKEGLKWAL